MDRIFLWGGNIQRKIATDAGISDDQIHTFNQPGFMVTNWELLSPAKQAIVIKDMAALGCTAAN